MTTLEGTPPGDNKQFPECNVTFPPTRYLNKVTIQDLQRQKVWHFLSSSWLSSDRGEGLTKKTLNAAKKNEIRSFRNIFQTRTSTGFRDQHIWVSIVDPPWRSPFTRAQRVSCCMSLLLCTMAINIAFWKIPKNQQSPVIFTIGSLKVTWEEIMVGVESGLLMFPINILIITIFRSIKSRVVQPKEKSHDMQGLKPLAVTMPTILKAIQYLIGYSNH
ncbi:polycystic kidney disease protein 1-like 2 [Salmo salar]|uniref:Polycystic kidney disease protein 1-like 2 n=1 Tax=Salmo salar TaxID=8030 RepID=A0ABM3CIC4_SALSA|nr:polycystic kidney disease protein 1-like 2 [Salmo salar]